MTGAGQLADGRRCTPASCSRTSLRTRSGRTSTCRRSRSALGFAVTLRPPSAADTPWADRDVLRPLDRPDLRALLEEHYAREPRRRLCCRRVSCPSSPVCSTRDAAEIGVFQDSVTDRTIIVCAIDNLGKGAAGQAVQNANLALRLRRDGRAAAVRSARLAMSVTAAQRLRRERRRGAGSGRPASRTSRSCDPSCRQSGPQCGRRTACRQRR